MQVECCGVAKTYGSGRRRQVALTGCSFSAGAGEIVGVLGPNGAGKTTLLGLVAGELTLTAGELRVLGHRAGTPAARRSVGYAPDPPLAPPELTGAEWLAYLASHRASSPRRRLGLVRWAVELAELETFIDRRVSTYSRGMAQRLGLAGAALLEAPVLALDEVLSGVDPLVQRRLREQLALLARGGRLVLIASHDLAALERVATRVLVLWDGQVLVDVATARLATERMVELTLAGSTAYRGERLARRFPGTVRTGHGVAVPLTGGRTVEEVLAACGEERIAVAASRVRDRALEDILVEAAARQGERA
jgi:ABC-type multidrug transport system ATPase subunit